MQQATVPAGASPERLPANFWRFAAAYTSIGLGDGVRQAALPLLAASVTRVPLAVAAVTFAESLPWLLVNLPSGVYVDRHDRRRIMQWAALARLALTVFLIGSILAQRVSVPLLVTVGFLLGCPDVFGSNAGIGLVRGVVKPRQLERANAVLSGVFSITGALVGPALGSLLFAGSAFLPFSAEALVVVVGVVLLATLRGQFSARRSAPAEADGSLWAEMAEGVRWLSRHRSLRTLSVLVGTSNLCWGMLYGILVLFVLEVMHLPKAVYGPLLASLALGGVAGAVVGGRWGRSWLTPAGLAATLAIQALAAAAAGYFAVLWVVVPAMALAGMASGIWDIVVISFRQRVVPDALIGRVTSGFRLFGLGAYPLGAILGGLVANHLGLRAPFFLSAGMLALVAGAALLLLRAEELRDAGPAAADP